MSPKFCLRITTVTLLIAAAANAQAAAGDPPPGSLDLGAVKPKAQTATAPGPGSVAPIGQSPLAKQKSAASPGGIGSTGIGSAAKSPLGIKGVLGGPVTAGKPAATEQGDAASSNDVVVKLPSNMRK